MRRRSVFRRPGILRLIEVFGSATLRCPATRVCYACLLRLRTSDFASQRSARLTLPALDDGDYRVATHCGAQRRRTPVRAAPLG